MFRLLLLPALAVALFAAEAASAQTVPAATAPAATKKEVRQAARAARRTGRVLTNREKRAAAAAAKAATVPAAAPALAWSGWSNDPLPETARTSAPNRADMSWSSAPGMPLNQVGHGVTTDYDGRPVRRAETASTTLPTVR